MKRRRGKASRRNVKEKRDRRSRRTRAPAALDLSRRVSPHFTLKELVRSATAERDEALKREQESPPRAVVTSLRHLTRHALEPIRAGIDAPLLITSGYRSTLVNKLVGGSATSQHCRGEAADCELTTAFLTDPASAAMRQAIRAGVEQRTGRPLRPDVDQNGYLFVYVCLNLEELDVDQVIHEYGDEFGRPAWVHVAASRRQDRRQVLFIGHYTDRIYLNESVDQALARCCA
jgi:hypothetical protein